MGRQLKILFLSILLSACGENLLSGSDFGSERNESLSGGSSGSSGSSSSSSSSGGSSSGGVIPSTCGNGVIDFSEACDDSVPEGTSCSSFGFNAGAISCSETCELDTSNCREPNREVKLLSLDDDGLHEGQSLTISGEGFGSKSRALPLLWDDLSSYTTLSEGDEIPAGRDMLWRTRSTTPPLFTKNSSFVRVPNRPVYKIQENNSWLGGHDYNLEPNSTFVVNWWFYVRDYAPGGEKAAWMVTKFARLWTQDSSSYSGINFYLRGSTNGADTRYFTGLSVKEWHHAEIIVFNSELATTDANTTLGRFRIIVDGIDVYGKDQYLLIDQSRGGDVSYIHRLGFDSRLRTDFAPGQDFRWGDLYVDQTLSRVIIADRPDFDPRENETKSHYEMQIPKSWSPSTITIKVNRGSFSSGSAWIYVIDSDNNISNSMQVSFE